MERIKLDNSTTISITPVGATTAVVVPLSKVINAIEASDNKFIRIDGKVYTHSHVQSAIGSGGASLVAKKVGSATNVAVPYTEVVKSIKTFGLQYISRIYNTTYDYYTTATLNVAVITPD